LSTPEVNVSPTLVLHVTPEFYALIERQYKKDKFEHGDSGKTGIDGFLRRRIAAKAEDAIQEYSRFKGTGNYIEITSRKEGKIKKTSAVLELDEDTSFETWADVDPTIYETKTLQIHFPEKYSRLLFETAMYMNARNRWVNSLVEEGLIPDTSQTELYQTVGQWIKRECIVQAFFDQSTIEDEKKEHLKMAGDSERSNADAKVQVKRPKEVTATGTT
jgi:hypothetical protein